MMAQTHIGYTAWNDPPADVMPPLVRGADLASVQPAPEPEREPDILQAIPIALFKGEGGGRFEWTRVPYLGRWGEAQLALPQGRPATAPADGVYLEYPLRLPEAGDYELVVQLVPTLDTIGDDGLRIGLSLDGGPVRELVVRLEPTNGQADTPPRAAWVKAVIDNMVELPARFDGLAAGEHRLRLYRIDDNVVPQAVLVRRTEAPAVP